MRIAHRPRAVFLAASIAFATLLGAGGALAAPAPQTGDSTDYHDYTTRIHQHGRKIVMPTPGSAAAARPAAAGPLVYGGGPIQRSPKAYLVFWGSQWSSDPQGVIPYLQSFFRGLGGGQDGWSRVMEQYCQGVASGAVSCGSAGTHIHFDGSVYAGIWLDTSVSAPYQATDDQIAAEATAAAAHFGNTTAASNVGVQYHVFSPQGTHPGGFPGAGFCAWHNNWSTQYGDISVGNEPYMPDGNGGCGTNWLGGALDGFSIVVGHEYAESVTDPIPNSGWVDTSGGENGDKCSWIRSGPGAITSYPLDTGKFPVQSTWSNQINGCQTSVPVPPPGCVAGQALGNPGFESGTAPWSASANVIAQPATWGRTAHSGSYAAWLDGVGSRHTDTLSQQVSIGSACRSATLSFWLNIFTAETTATQAYDTLALTVNGATLATWSNLDANTGYAQRTFDLSYYAGQTVTIGFTGTEDDNLQTSFLIDDAALVLS
ncbi:hypothetical protein F0L68_18450 [Solihabitans fulvus]|uniref:Serine protease n=1 Tax=Solihabitans fulvus TaxID=1892852 RepID=A0A5B2XDI3_9PSEU|nr:hypothetical protein [Solihabitans fulvus]KAA2261050.1 hypothetical protein F0L68_18450 [Solihabitans fulvus]